MPRRPPTTEGRHQQPRRRLRGLRWALAVVALTAGAVALLSPAPAPAPAPALRAADSPPAPVVLTTPTVRAVAPPARVSIPAIGVDSELSPIGVDGSGALVPPSDFSRVGWFAAGPAPGEVGPAVLAGHVDDYTGPAVFYRLEDLTAGDQVVVTGGDGQTVPFTVTRVAAYPKSSFATAEVYGPTTGAELRLITCGGTFDRSRRSYTDNVVVFARAT